MTDRNDRIRESAYFLWLEEGRLKTRRSVIDLPPKASSRTSLSRASPTETRLSTSLKSACR